MQRLSKADVTSKLVKVISHPDFQKFLQEVEGMPSAQRFEFATKVTNIEELRKRGVEVPDDLNIKVRTFDGDGKEVKNQVLAGGHWSICIGTVITICYQF